jgi:transposase
MSIPYDVALRERAVQAYERGAGSYAQVAALFQVDSRTLERWVARWRTTGSVAPRPRGGGWRSPSAGRGGAARRLHEVAAPAGSQPFALPG